MLGGTVSRVTDLNASPLTEPLTPSAAKPLSLKLQVVDGPDFGAELVLQRGTYRVGKDEDCDLVLHDASVSRTHLLIAVLEGGARLTDNQSTNGTTCDGTRFSVVEAKPGAEISLGRTVLRLVPAETRASVRPPSERTSFGELLGQSLPMRQVFALLERLAQVDSDVLIRGETGTGKELCAEALHAQGPRAKGPFVICDLAGVAPALIESELFGHVRGAFTGAISDRAGAFEQAHHGVLFLDEVGELPLEAQPRLLRALERRQLKRVGSNTYKTFSVRVIAATHRDLREEVAAGRFRADLYHRLAVAEVALPPLRERAEDLPLLVEALLSRLGHAAGLVSAQTLALLAGYGWPGNVRELRNVVEQVVHLGEEPDLPHTETPRTASALAGLPFKEAKDQLVQAFERDYLAQLMKTCEGNLSRASREAGIDRVYLRKLLRKHGLRSADGEE